MWKMGQEMTQFSISSNVHYVGVLENCSQSTNIQACSGCHFLFNRISKNAISTNLSKSENRNRADYLFIIVGWQVLLAFSILN